MDKNGLIIANGIVLGGTVLLNSKSTENNPKGKLGSKQNTKNTVVLGGTVVGKLILVGIFLVVSSFMFDQAPEFMGPFLLLVLVAAIARDAPLISDYYKTIQGNSK
jgi:hypothetical protein